MSDSEIIERIQTDIEKIFERCDEIEWVLEKLAKNEIDLMSEIGFVKMNQQQMEEALNELSREE